MDPRAHDTILLVEDDLINAISTEAVLKSLGYDVVHARSGRQAIDRAIANERIRLVVTDIGLGAEPDGIATAQEILRHRELPIVFITSHDDADTAVKASSVLHYGILPKHADPYALQTAIDVALRLFASHHGRSGDIADTEANRYRTIIHTSMDGFWMIDEQGRVIEANQTLCRMTGYTEQELLRMSLFDLKPPDKAVDTTSHLQVIREKGEERFETRYRRKDGTYIDVEASVQYRTFDGGRFLIFAKDLTERRRMEQALRENEMLLHEAETIARLGIYVLDINSGRWRSSKVLDDIFGIDSLYERSVERWEDIIHPDDRSMMIEYFRHDVIGQGHPFDKEYRIVRQDTGATRVVHGLGKLEVSDAGVPVTMYGTIQDITERTLADQKLRKSEERFRTYIERSPDAVFLVDGSGRYLDVNPAAVALLGFSREEMLSMSVRDINPDPAAASLPATFQHLRQSGSVVSELHLRRRDGSTVPVILNAVKLSESEYIAFCTDITGRKQSDALMAQLAAIVQSSHDAIIGKDLRGNITSWNASAERLFEYTAEEIIGQPIARLVPPSLIDEEQRILSSIARGEAVATLETKRLTKSGNLLDVSITVSPIRDGTGRIIGASKAARDISERKRADDRIAALLREKEMLLKEVHHRIKNNMNSMKSLLSMQAAAISDPAAVAALKDAEARMRGMMLLYDKLYRSPSVSEAYADEYLSVLLDQIAATFPARQNIQMEMHLGHFPIDARTMSAVGLIVNELVTNTIKHAFPEGNNGLITVSISRNNARIALTVRDNGVGISPSTNARGGFGLQLVEMLVEQLEGSLRVEHTNGTAFLLEFTLAEPAQVHPT